MRFYAVAGALLALSVGAAACRQDSTGPDDDILERCAARAPLAVPDTVTATLTESDCVLGDGSLADVYELTVTAAQADSILLRSDDFDAFLWILDAEGEVLETNDEFETTSLDARVVRSFAPGTYYVVANAFDDGETGDYVLSVTPPRTP